MRIVSGSKIDVVVVLRRVSLNFRKVATFVSSEQNGQLVWIPPGFAHGYFVISDAAEALCSVTDYHYPEYERMLHWCDPALAIN
jgi:dTDP-4-dehydrorhamnose 3,5-epimerase